MDFVFDQMRDSGSLVVLANARGLLLHSLGDADFLGRAERVSLRPGALWHESDRGTNAIGTCLAESRAVVIHGAEHYLERNGFLTCSAAPVFGPRGQLLRDVGQRGRPQVRRRGGQLPPYGPCRRDRLLDLRRSHGPLLSLARNFGTHNSHASTTRSSMVSVSNAAMRATTHW